jgi:glutamyl-tRNA synthetase
VSDWHPAALEAAIGAYAASATEGNLGKVAQPLRVAVSGGTVSPPIFDTLAILGKASTLERMRRCLQAFGG